MALKNSLQPASKKAPLSVYLSDDAVKARINQVVGGENGQRFISSIVSATHTTPALQSCTNQSIVSAALLGESLKLSPSPQLGHYYMVPYDDKNRGKIAQFQMGYKGYIQLALRSGQYRKINVLAIKEGELEAFDPLNEEIQVKIRVDDWEAREAAKTVGYYAMFELTNGFRKALFWSRSRMESHAKKYSPGYKRDLEKGTAYTFWSKSFDDMAYKTMIRQLISKWGIMSIEMQSAYASDMAVINEDGTAAYVENDAEEIPDFGAGAAEIAFEDTEPAESVPETDSDVQSALFGDEG